MQSWAEVFLQDLPTSIGVLGWQFLLNHKRKKKVAGMVVYHPIVFLE